MIVSYYVKTWKNNKIKVLRENGRKLNNYKIIVLYYDVGLPPPPYSSLLPSSHPHLNCLPSLRTIQTASFAFLENFNKTFHNPCVWFVHICTYMQCTQKSISHVHRSENLYNSSWNSDTPCTGYVFWCLTPNSRYIKNYNL